MREKGLIIFGRPNLYEYAGLINQLLSLEIL